MCVSVRVHVFYWLMDVDGEKLSKLCCGNGAEIWGSCG